MADLDGRELRLCHVGAHVDRVEVGDLVERLARLHHLAGSRVGREHRAGDRVRHLAFSNPLAGLRDLRFGPFHLFARGLALRLDGFDLLRLRHDLPLLRLDLLVLRFDLIGQDPVVLLRLVQLLRGRRLLGKQPLGALVSSPGDLLLCDQRAALSVRGIALRRGSAALRPKDVDLLTDLVDTRRAGRALGRELIALERQLRRIDRAHDRLSLEFLPFSDSQRKDAPACLRADDDLGGFDVAIGVWLRRAGAPRRRHQPGRER